MLSGIDIIEYITQSVNKFQRKRGDAVVNENIKRICKEKGIPVSQLERNADISKGYVYHMVNPSVDMLKRIAQELDVDVCDLLKEDCS